MTEGCLSSPDGTLIFVKLLALEKAECCCVDTNLEILGQHQESHKNFERGVSSPESKCWWWSHEIRCIQQVAKDDLVRLETSIAGEANNRHDRDKKE